MTEAQRWFAQHSAGAPAPLQQRAAGYLAAEPEGPGVAERLAASAGAALDRVLAHPGDRTVALDLLAADALVTLALKARAGEDPAALASFAAGLRRAHRTPR